jgi:predicted TIM-barrel fold metal-dependent hydrolase
VYDFAGPDRLLFATDHPWVDPNLIVRSIESPKLPREDEEKIFAGNARQISDRFRLTFLSRRSTLLNGSA